MFTKKKLLKALEGIDKSLFPYQIEKKFSELGIEIVSINLFTPVIIRLKYVKDYKRIARILRVKDPFREVYPHYYYFRFGEIFFEVEE